MVAGGVGQAGAEPTSSADLTDGSSRSATAGLPDLVQQLTAHEWVLDRADSSLTSSDTSPVTLRFAADRTLAGMGPCNSYFGPFTIEGDTTIEVGGLGSTRRACAPEVMAAEDEYLTALGSVSTVDATDRNRLVLEDGATRLAYRALDVADELIGTWDVVSLASGDAIVSVLPGTEPVVTFDEDGTLSADAGCNALNSQWSLEGSDLQIDPPASTRMFCGEPDGVMDQEAALSAALDRHRRGPDRRRQDQPARRGRLDRAHRHPQGRRRELTDRGGAR